MRAAVCRAFGEPLVIEQVTLAAPRAGEVEVKLAACAICHSDIMAAEGLWGGVLPAVYGHEAAGYVSALGAGVTGVSIGDPVVVTLIRACGACPSCNGGHPTDCEGGYDRLAQSPLTDKTGAQLEQGMATAGFAEKVVVDQSQIFPIPTDMPMDEASLLACGVITGVGAVTNAAQLPKGASTVVVGAGGVGLNTIQGAAMAGADPLIVLDLDAEKLTSAKEFGATHTVDARSNDVADQIKALTGGRGAEFVFVTVGALPAFQAALDYLGPRGEMVMVGMTAVGDEMTLEPVNITASSQVLRGTKMGDTVLERDMPKLLEWYKCGRLKLAEMISNRYSLDQVNEAIADSKSGQSRRNVILFDR